MYVKDSSFTSLTTHTAYPENLVIYHAGTGRTTFIACLKLTTIFIFVFFGLVVTPAYVKSEHPLWQAGGRSSPPHLRPSSRTY